MRFNLLLLPESLKRWSHSCPVRSACLLFVYISGSLESCRPWYLVPMEHDPLRNRYNALLRFIQSGELSQNSVISVGHYDYSTRLEMFVEA